ncbi:MAG: hypothetical protein WCL13_04280 [bacterium]
MNKFLGWFKPTKINVAIALVVEVFGFWFVYFLVIFVYFAGGMSMTPNAMESTEIGRLVSAIVWISNAPGDWLLIIFGLPVFWQNLLNFFVYFMIIYIPLCIVIGLFKRSQN